MKMDPPSLPGSLRAISDALARIAARAERFEPLRDTAAEFDAGDDRSIDRTLPLLVAVARIDYDLREERARHVDMKQLGEHAWDILLDLFIQKSEGREVSLTSVAIGSRAPTSTAMRHFATLEEAGFVTREKSDADGRVTIVDLTPEGITRVSAYLRERAEAIEMQFIGAHFASVAAQGDN